MVSGCSSIQASTQTGIQAKTEIQKAPIRTLFSEVPKLLLVVHFAATAFPCV